MKHEDLMALRQAGMEKAATAWEAIEAANPPFDPVNVFKATSSIKCAEMLTRLRSSTPSAFEEILDVISNFIEGTLSDVGGAVSGNIDEGMRIVQRLEELFPFSEEDFASASAFAIRMHTYDGVLLLAASKFGMEAITKDRIENMQSGIAEVIIRDIIRLAQAEA